jgi:DNA-binding transcriptional LysR family regulator
MRFPFTLRQLELFELLSQCRSFRRTADTLNISQAAVSAGIRALEQQLGVTLFERQAGRRPNLSAEGIAFLEDFRRFLGAAETLASHRRGRAKTTDVRIFKIFVGQPLLDIYIRPKLNAFFFENPNIQFDFRSDLPVRQTVRKIPSQNLDFALFHYPTLQMLGSEYRELAQVHSGIFAHRDLVAGRPLPLDRQVVDNLPFILAMAGSPLEREQLEEFARFDIRPRKIVGRTQFTDVVTGMVERGHGVARLIEPLIPTATREEVVKIFPLSDWRLVLYRKDHRPNAQIDIVERFLIASVVDDAIYLKVASVSHGSRPDLQLSH